VVGVRLVIFLNKKLVNFGCIDGKPESEQELYSQIWKFFGPGPAAGFKNFWTGVGLSLKIWLRPPLQTTMHLQSVC